MQKDTHSEITVRDLLRLCRKAVRDPLAEELALSGGPDLPEEAAVLLSELSAKGSLLMRMENLIWGEGRVGSLGLDCEDASGRGKAGELLWTLEEQLARIKQGDNGVRLEDGGLLSAALNQALDTVADLSQRLKMQENTLNKLMRSLEKGDPKGRNGMDELKASEARFRYLAEHDELTKTYSRVYFMHYAVKALKSARHKGKPCCIAIMDLDFFKTVNDRYGHLSGDKVLASTAMIAGAVLRSGDTMARYGGEEFVFFFNNTTLEQGHNVAERIRNALHCHPVIINEQESLAVTVSLGVACVNPDALGERDKKFLNEVLHQADKAMYRAKRQGRNQTCLAPDLPPALGQTCVF